MKTLRPLRDHFAKLVSLFPEREFVIVPKTDGDYPFPSKRNSWAAPYIEVQGDEYHYVASERGSEVMRAKTLEADEINFWISCDYTRWIASRYELQHRLSSEDSRRQWMGLHVQLLARVNPKWAQRVKDEYDEILAKHPFRDEGQVKTVEPDAYSITEA